MAAPDGKTEPGGEARGTGDAKPKIHVDDDWKQQARVERERLAQELKREEGGAGPGRGSGEAGAARLPPPDFETLARSLATQALMFLADERDPKTGESLRRLDLAKHSIDLLSVLEEKTRGNLNDGEKRLLDTLLYELRMAYVSAAS